MLKELFISKLEKELQEQIDISDLDKTQINPILEKLGYNYTINDIYMIDKYLKNRSCSNNSQILTLIEKIYLQEQDKPNSLFKERINELQEFKKIIDNNLFPYVLVNSFNKVRKPKNLYWSLIEIEKVMKNNQTNKKDMLLIYLTYNYKIDKNLEDSFKNIDISKEDIIEFLKKLEEKEIILDDKKLENLLKNFKYRYYQRRKLNDKYRILSNKVIKEYSIYYDNNFYFSPKEFVKHYNDTYDDDFSFFVFSEQKIPLTESILYSLFKQDSLLSNYFLFKEENQNIKILRKLKLSSEKYEKQENDTYKARKKFYRKYKCKLNKFMNDKDICFKYFIIKYIDTEDRAEFYELFKKIYKDTYKEIESRKVTTKNKAMLLKKDFILELSTTSFKDRYSIIDKYKEYATYIECDTHIKDNYYSIVIEELERQYYLLTAKNIVLRLKEALTNGENISSLYENIEKYVKKELLLDNIDSLFNKLTRKHDKLKKTYQSLKKEINKKTINKKLTKRKSVK